MKFIFCIYFHSISVTLEEFEYFSILHEKGCINLNCIPPVVLET